MTKPKELYIFHDTFRTWYYTSADSAETHNGNTYIPVALGHDNIESKNELSKAQLTITMSLDNEMSKQLLRSNLDFPTTLTVFSKDLESGNVYTIWKGRMLSIKPTMSSIQLIFESVFTSLRRTGLRLHYQRTCPHPLYGVGCNVDRTNFYIEDTLANVFGLEIEVWNAASKPDGWFTGGYVLEFYSYSKRFIVKHVRNTLTLTRPFNEIAFGTALMIFAGCNRTQEHCKDKFDNILNFGGFPFIPIKNPFGGGSIA